jgi:hypothetical protein
MRDRSTSLLDATVDSEGVRCWLDQSSCTANAIFVVPFAPHSYGALPMASGTRHGLRSRRSNSVRTGLFTMCAVITLAAVSGSCKITNGTPKSVGISIPRGPVSDARSTSSSPIAAAWLASEMAFEQAALTADPDQPELDATTVAPQLPWTRSLLAQMQSAGEVARGSVDYGRPRVLVQRAGVATVQSCEHDGEIVVSLATGRAVSGQAGQVEFELFTSTMEWTPSGWKLATQTVGVSQCHAS